MRTTRRVIMRSRPAARRGCARCQCVRYGRGPDKPERAAEQDISHHARQRRRVSKIAPFKVFDNLYYVGPGYVSAWALNDAARRHPVRLRDKSLCRSCHRGIAILRSQDDHDRHRALAPVSNRMSPCGVVRAKPKRNPVPNSRDCRTP